MTEEAQQEAPAQDPAIAAEAAKYGWKPADQFDLAPEGWVDAERFMELPQTKLKQARDEKAAMQADFEKKLEEQSKAAEQRLRKIEAVTSKAVAQMRERHQTELEEVREAKRRAVEVADVEKYDSLSRREEQLEEAAAHSATEAADPPAPDKALLEYREKNTWIQDPNLLKEALEIVNNNPAIASSNDGVAQAEYAKKFLLARYPNMFEQPEQEAPKAQPKVDSGGLAGGSFGGDEPQLDPEALAAGKRFIDEGIFPDMKAYIKAYNEQG